MSGIKNFIIGFSLSLFSVTLIGRLHSSVDTEIKKFPSQNIKIDLFKTASASVIPQATPALFAEIKKESLIRDDFSKTTSNISPEGTEDDEILSVNVDGIIPIEFSSTNLSDAEILYQSEDNESAMLPTEEIIQKEDFSNDSPWVIAKGSKHIKNKKLLEQFENEAKPSLLSDNFAQLTKENEDYSYKVAEKIKQSIIFPIPDEILNDEDLTPTFIKKTSKPKPSTQKKQKKSTPTSDELKIIRKEAPVSKPQTVSKDSSILDSFSSWFSDKPVKESTPPAPVQKKRVAPTYSRTATPSAAQDSTPSSNEDLADFYETLQETKAQYAQKIIPSELKMSFRPGRAEISGSTLQWLKMFSEATSESSTYLEVRLDASTSPELQKKRLNLLYSIFANNGVDLTKINTIFSLTEPNAFIIKVIKQK
ncbi:MAG: hypothetical protein J6J35_03705 [Alphaproteobacteria bacterium]|nr:hypothetical protein [Alphaproteobacteria bacterium]